MGHYGCNTNGEHEKCDCCGYINKCNIAYKQYFEDRGETTSMSDVWKNIFKDWISCYNSIEQLGTSGIVDEEESNRLQIKLLDDIIETMRSEVEE